MSPGTGPGDRLVAAALAGGAVGSRDAEIVMVEWTDPGGPNEPRRYIAPMHIHHDDDEAWYVLDGALGVRLADHDAEVLAGGAILVPRGMPHAYWNAQEGPTRYLLVMTPRIQALVDALHAPGLPADAIEATFREHHSELIGWP
jgi:mannose-6-phosphate isomerase-like protein (cupin superfamily)